MFDIVLVLNANWLYDDSCSLNLPKAEVSMMNVKCFVNDEFN